MAELLLTELPLTDRAAYNGPAAYRAAGGGAARQPLLWTLTPLQLSDLGEELRVALWVHGPGAAVCGDHAGLLCYMDGGGPDIPTQLEGTRGSGHPGVTPSASAGGPRPRGASDRSLRGRAL
ncbi:unnamed protein product [Ranitomeya imitator]|uniref:Uncharacterized protein n=1 Tax=Ranitomeya imitator TaxID=111125 RepID=A0ABN9KN00_9NEOB|nr:unnamed protein product [Ranitomeya imitator]